MYGDPKSHAAFFDAEPAREVLGRAVHDALAASRFITPGDPKWYTVILIPTEDEINARQEDLKRRAGVKTNKALYTGVGSVAVTLGDGQIELLPLRHRGRGAWEGIRGIRAHTIARVGPDAELGDATAVVSTESKPP